MAIFGPGVKFKHCFGVYSHSIGMVSDFLWPYWDIDGFWVRFTNCFRVYLKAEKLFFSMFPSILTFTFDLSLGSFVAF